MGSFGVLFVLKSTRTRLGGAKTGGRDADGLSRRGAVQRFPPRGQELPVGGEIMVQARQGSGIGVEMEMFVCWIDLNARLVLHTTGNDRMRS